MKSAFEDKEIWFLTGSQDLYSEETLRQVAHQSQEVVTALNKSGEIPVPIVWKPTLKDSDSIRRTLLEANSNDNVVGVITWMHTFSPAKMWINGLGALRKPLLHLHTQANVDLPWGQIDFDYMNLNQSAHGDREYAYILSRLRITRETVVGHVGDPKVRARVSTWARACVGWSAVHGLNVVRFGDNMRNVAVTDGDKTEAERVLGVNVSTWSANELVEEIDQVTEAEAEALTQEYERLYDVAPELRAGGDRHESLVYAAKQEIALRRFLDARGAGAFTTNFEDLGAHMLEICPSLTSDKPRVEIHPLDIGGKDDPVRMVFSTDPGPAVVVSLADMGTRFRLTANEIDVVTPPAPMPNLPVAHAVWEPKPSLEVSAECWMESGGAHHTVLTNAVSVEVFRIFADLARMELLVIGEDTTVAAFKDKIRWNFAYYHLASGV